MAPERLNGKKDIFYLLGWKADRMGISQERVAQVLADLLVLVKVLILRKRLANPNR